MKGNQNALQKYSKFDENKIIVKNLVQNMMLYL